MNKLELKQLDITHKKRAGKISWGKCLGQVFGQMPKIHECPGIYRFKKYGIRLYELLIILNYYHKNLLLPNITSGPPFPL